MDLKAVVEHPQRIVGSDEVLARRSEITLNPQAHIKEPTHTTYYICPTKREDEFLRQKLDVGRREKIQKCDLNGRMNGTFSSVPFP